MADKRIDQLVAATTVGDDDLLVLQQNNQAKKLSGKKLGDYVYAAAASKVAEVEQAVADAQAAIDDLESQKDTIAQAVAAMADLGTDTTLTTAGMAADAEATGDRIKELHDLVDEELDDLQIALESMITGVEEFMTATQNYTIDALFVANGKLYKATSAIASGETIEPTVNCEVTTIEEQLNALKDAKADIDGHYERMTVGLADNLVSTTGANDKVPYNFRTSGGAIDIGDRETETIVGGTIAWNQLVTTDTNVSKTKSGSVVSVTDAVAENAQSLVVDITPQQDLHGYDHPWVGGAGKNLCPTPIEENVVYRNGGYMFTTTFDNGVITWTITGNASTYFMLKAFTITESHVGKTYTMSFLSTPTIALGTASCLQLWDGTDRTTLDSPTVTITSDMVGKDLCLSFYKNGEGTYIISNVQLEEGSTATDYEPYENICPITGFTGANVYDDPRYGGLINFNQLARPKQLPYTHNGITTNMSDGVYTLTGTTTTSYSSNIISITLNSGHKYYQKLTTISNPNNVSFSCGSLNGVIAAVSTSAPKRLTTANQTMLVTMGVQSMAASTSVEGISYSYVIFDLTQMFGAGNEPTTIEEVEAIFPNNYYAYNAGEVTNAGAMHGETSRHVSVSFPSEAGTVYGGTLDVTSGELVVTTAINDLGTLNWTADPNRSKFRYAPLPNCKNGGNKVLACSCYKAGNRGVGEVSDFEISGMYSYSGESCFIQDSRTVDMTREQLQELLSGETVAYLLATPIEYTLTPQQVQMLLGANNVWSDTGSINALTYLGTTNEIAALTNHKYLTKINGAATIVNGSEQVLSGEKGRDNIFDLTQMFGTEIANHAYILEQTTAGTGVSWFNRLFPKPYYSYNAGELMSVNTSAHKMVGFNAWDGTYQSNTWLGDTNGTISSDSGYNLTDFIKVVPNAGYYKSISGSGRVLFYDINKTVLPNQQWNTIVSGASGFTVPNDAYYVRFVITTVNLSTFCINLSWDGEHDGEYEAYEEHVYPLDSSLTLRGIPKLASDNSLYYDGDIYESDGTVTRKYGIIDLGTLTWTYQADQSRFYSTGISSYLKSPATNSDTVGVICGAYRYMSLNNLGINSDGCAVSTTKNIYIKDARYTNASDLATALSGTYCVYELATPTTESANPYTNPQLVDDFGTEEYIDYAVSQGTREVAVPVGHDTLYVVNLRAKLEMAPDSPEENGDYIMRKTNDGNSYVPLTEVKELPNMPTINGNYSLKLTVANGTPTLTWVMA